VRSIDDPAVAEHRDVLDLRARVHAQRGELAEAAACWTRVLDQRPEDEAATAGLARIARLGRTGPVAALSRHRTRTALVAAMCVVAATVTAVAAVTTGGVLGGTDGGTRATPHSTDQAAPRSSAQAQAGQDSADELAAENRREQALAAARRTAAVAALADELQGPGLRPQVRGDSVEVTFTEGLFSQGAQLTTAGAAQLAALGEKLTGRQADITIYGQAATVPGAPQQGGSVTSLWRALVAARELSAASGKPLTAFTTASADQQDAPYQDAAKNRTVTVVITPK